MGLKRILKHAKRRYCDSISNRHSKPLGPPTESERQLVELLRREFREQVTASSTNGPEAVPLWLQNVDRLRSLVLDQDPRGFLRWDVVERTMALTSAPYIAVELADLQGRPDWADRWSRVIQEDPAGHPRPYWRYPASSETLIHHAYHWAQFEEKTELRLDEIDCIFEFGGGYGGMCRLLRRLGFRKRYVLFDLPAFSALQRYFLRSLGLAVASQPSFESGQDAVLCTSRVDEVAAALATREKSAPAVFIGTWSISEVPAGLRREILSLVSEFTGFLMAYQMQFEQIDNDAFFKEIKAAWADVTWTHWPIEHIPKNMYLMGRRTVRSQACSSRPSGAVQ